jgi:hypothetical protein
MRFSWLKEVSSESSNSLVEKADEVVNYHAIRHFLHGTYLLIIAISGLIIVCAITLPSSSDVSKQ